VKRKAHCFILRASVVDFPLSTGRVSCMTSRATNGPLTHRHARRQPFLILSIGKLIYVITAHA